MAKTAKPNPTNDPEMAALFQKLQDADKWLPGNTNQLAAEKFGLGEEYIQYIRWGKKMGRNIRWNVDVVLFLLEMAKERKEAAQRLMAVDF